MLNIVDEIIKSAYHRVKSPIVKFKAMHSLDPFDLSDREGLAVEQIEHDGWTCTASDPFSTTDFTYDNGQLVDVHHSSLDSALDDGVRDFSDVGYDLNYASTVDSIAQGYDLHSHQLSETNLNPYDLSYLETPSLDTHVPADSFYPAAGESSGVESFMAMPRSGTAPDYGEAARNEGWAKFHEDSAKSWASEGSLSMAASKQAEADAYHAKAAENLNQ